MTEVSISSAVILVVIQYADRGLDLKDRYQLECAHKQMLNYYSEKQNPICIILSPSKA
jgi:hypothetical protein